MGKNPFAKLPYLPNILAHPRWLAVFVADGMIRPFPNIVVPGSGPLAAIDVAAALESAQVSWTDLKWIREVWKGPIVMKGVMTADDARRSVDHGAQGVVVSTHGGRQLDSCAGSFACVPGILEAVGSQIDMIFDGGIRRGSDLVKAMAWAPRLSAGPRLCLWHGGGGRRGDRARDGDLPRRYRAHSQAAGLLQHLGA